MSKVALTTLPTKISEWSPILWYVWQLFVLGLSTEVSDEERSALNYFFHTWTLFLPDPFIREVYQECLSIRPVHTFMNQLTKWLQWLNRKFQSHMVVKDLMPAYVVLETLPESKLEWGSKVWYVMELVALSLGTQPSTEKQEAAFRFYESLQVLLPCEECRQHYQDTWHLRPVTNFLVNATECLYWVNWVHKRVTTNTPIERSVTTPIQEKKEVIIITSLPMPPVRQKYLKPTVNRNTKSISSVAKTSSQVSALTKLAEATKKYSRPCSC